MKSLLHVQLIYNRHFDFLLLQFTCCHLATVSCFAWETSFWKVIHLCLCFLFFFFFFPNWIFQPEWWCFAIFAVSTRKITISWCWFNILGCLTGWQDLLFFKFFWVVLLPSFEQSLTDSWYDFRQTLVVNEVQQCQKTGTEVNTHFDAFLFVFCGLVWFIDVLVIIVV